MKIIDIIIISFIISCLTACNSDKQDKTSNAPINNLEPTTLVANQEDNKPPQKDSIAMSSRYEKLQRDFLNAPQEEWFQIDFNAFSDGDMATLAEKNLAYNTPTPLNYGLGFYERAGKKWSYFGYPRSCKDKNDEQALCFTNTGGSRGGAGYGSETKGGRCGNYVGYDPIDSANLNKNICYDTNNNGTVIPSAWSSFNWWVGLGSNFDYVSDHFENASQSPLNRFCFEMELPVEKLKLTPADSVKYLLEKNNLYTQIVNQEIAHDNAKGLGIALGTYTATRTELPNKTKDEEFGGSYQNGGSHYYHNPSSYKSIVTDKIYFYDDRSFIFCAGNLPNGVRTGMRPNYATNPLYMIGGKNKKGETNATSYWNQMGRVYVRYISGPNTEALYPLDLKFRRIFMTYEPNDIFIMQNNGAVLSELFSEIGDKVTQTLTLYNFAEEDRSYRLGMNMGSILPFNGKSKKFKLYHDKNTNGKIDSEDIELIPTKTFNLAANTDMELIVWYDSSDMEDQWIGSFTAHGRKFVHGSFYVQEVGRLRSASFGIRIWKKQPNETIDREKWEAISRYKSKKISLSFDKAAANTQHILTFKLKDIEHTIDYRFDANKTELENLEELGKRLANVESTISHQINNYNDEKSISFHSTSYQKYIELLNIKNFNQQQTREGDWYNYRKLNNEAPDNSPYLIRSTIDYKKAIKKAKQRLL